MAYINWDKLRFSYTQTRTMIYSRCIDGKWETPVATEDFSIPGVTAFTAAFHYAPVLFEGLKAFRGEDGRIRIFRPDMNAKRMQEGADFLDMPAPSEEMFIEMCIRCVQTNLEFLPPFEASGASLYLRPVLFGYNQQLGVHSPTDVFFAVVCCPVGVYSGDRILCPARVAVSRNYDRVAPCGSGHYKLGANYAPSLHPLNLVHQMGYNDLLFLDPATKTYIEEFGSSNFFGIKGNTYITPLSDSILPSITNDSLRTVAKDMGLKVEVRKVRLEEIAEMDEVNSCGTAVVLTPIRRVDDKPRLESAEITRTYLIGDGENCGPITRQLYDHIIGIQKGLEEDKYGWCAHVRQ